MISGRLELRHLRYFLAVAEELHFGRAAARLAVSQPALSVQIRQLEDGVGARLFDRHSRHVALTDAGRTLREAGGRLLRDLEAAVEAARRASTGETGLLRLGFGPTLMLSTLAPRARQNDASRSTAVLSASSGGVRMHQRLTNSSAKPESGPEFSVPATGCAGMKCTPAGR